MRKSIRWILAALIVVVVTPLVSIAAVRGKECLYVGGTVPGFSENTQGTLDLSDGDDLIFETKDGKSFQVRYDRITSLEYGQKAGRRLGVALAITPWALLSKKRRHFLTIGYTDSNDKPQGIVLEIAKNEVAATLVVIEARSGRKIEYESLEAKDHVHG